MTRALIVGAGSIGVRHASVLAELGGQTAYVTARTDLPDTSFASVADGVATFEPDYVVVATETGAHARSVRELAAAGFAGRLLVEKPLAVASADLSGFSFVGVGFNLRFHPVILRLAELLADQQVYTVEAYVGQHLSTWRPDRKVSDQYSASRARGGGVLRDLSHEWDYLSVLFGTCRGLIARGGRLSTVTEDSDDAWGILAEYERAVVLTLQLNYLDTHTRRRMVINTSAGTVEADLVGSTLRVNDSTQTFTVERNTTYRAMHEAVLGGGDGVATPIEAHGTDAMIEMVEASAASRQWVDKT